MSISKTRKQWLSCSMPFHSSMNEYSLEILIFSLARFFRSKSHSQQIYSCELPSRATEIFRCSFQPRLCRHACLKYLPRRNSELHFHLKRKNKKPKNLYCKVMVRTIGNDLFGSDVPRTIALRALQTYRVRVFSSAFRTGSEHKKKRRNDEPHRITPSVALRLADKLVPLLKHFRVARSANRYIKTSEIAFARYFR